MFEYSRMYLEELWQKIKKLGLFIKYLFSIAFIVIFAYSLFTERGNIIVNIVLLSTNVIYFIYQAITENKKGKKADSQKKLAKNIKDWIYILKKAYEAGFAVYGLVITVSAPTTISIIMTLVNVVICLLKIAFELLEYVVENYLNKFTYALMSDVDDIKHPFRDKAQASIIVDGMTKEEIAQAKFRQECDTKMELWQSINKEKDLTKKELKKLKRLKEKQEKKAERARAKEINRNKKLAIAAAHHSPQHIRKLKKAKRLKEKQAKQLEKIQKKQQKERDKIQAQIDKISNK